MSGLWTDPSFNQVMKEQEPANRARFLALTYSSYPESFTEKTPDQMLVSELGIEKYLELLGCLDGVLPIVAIPTKELTA